GDQSFVHALHVLPSGELLAAGRFTHAGGERADNLASWDGSEWQPVAGGLRDRAHFGVSAATSLPTGEVVVVGSFDSVGGTPIKNVAIWAGSAWSGTSGGMDDRVQAALILPDGKVIIGGDFTYAPGGVEAKRIAMWDGATWRQLGDGFNQRVLALGQLSNGDVIAGG